jgi:hypothetical protein
MVVSPIVVTKPERGRVVVAGDTVAGAARRRRISPEAGRALVILGHAIDYLTDEYIHRGGQFRPGDPETEAIHMLMAANRAVYFECPVVPSLRERCLRLLGIGRARGNNKF